MDIQFTHSTYQSWFDKLNLTTQQIEMLSIELTRLIDREKPGFEVDYKAGRQDAFNAVLSLITGTYDATDYCPSTFEQQTSK